MIHDNQESWLNGVRLLMEWRPGPFGRGVSPPTLSRVLVRIIPMNKPVRSISYDPHRGARGVSGGC